MLQKFTILFSSILFYIGLELIVTHNDWVLRIALLMVIVSLFQARKIGGSIVSGLVPSIFALATVSLLYLVDSSRQQQTLIFLSFCIYFLAFLGIYRLRYNEHDSNAWSLLSMTSMAASFFAYAGLYGIYLNFAFSIGTFMLSYAVITMLLSYQYLYLIDKDSKKRSGMYSLILGLALAQIAWIVTFWPFGYLTTGVIVLMLQYILWFLVQSHFLQELSKRSVFVHMLLLSVLVGMVLVSTRWAPIV